MKTNPPVTSGSPGVASRRTISIAAGALAVAVLVANWNSFSAPFVFDDIASIVANPTIRTFGHALSPPHDHGVTVGGRPLLNLSFALNYAISGEAVWSYHALNLAIHLAAALTLFGLMRRTLLQPQLSARCGANAMPLALATAALWALHPVQTESVAYTVQRAESLMGFFYLLALYAFVRAVVSEEPLEAGSLSRRGAWMTLSVGACALGMTVKETMVSAPLVALLYDRTFVSGTFRAAWRARRGYYVALAVTWIPLVWLVLGTGGRGGTAGFDTTVSSWTYALTQCGAIAHYLRLVFWPQPLIFDYGVDVVRHAADVALPALLLISLLGATLFALVRRPAVGFLGACFFAVLAPSSSFVPIASQPVAEHRLYLPVAAVLALLVVGTGAWLGRWTLWLWLAVAVLCGSLTWRRNETYRNELALWNDTVLHRPGNARAQSNLGNALVAAGRVAEAAPHYEEALRLSPDYADGENNLGHALVQLGHPADAIPHLEAALRAKPDSVEALTNFGSALVQTGRAREALAVYEHALQLQPDAIGARYNLANALFQLGDFSAAATRFTEVIKLQPEHNDARFNLAATLLRLGRTPEAIVAYEELLRRAPNDATAHAELANILSHLGRVDEAITHYETALRLRPDFPAARTELDRLRAAPGGTKP